MSSLVYFGGAQDPPQSHGFNPVRTQPAIAATDGPFSRNRSPCHRCLTAARTSTKAPHLCSRITALRGARTHISSSTLALVYPCRFVYHPCPSIPPLPLPSHTTLAFVYHLRPRIPTTLRIPPYTTLVYHPPLRIPPLPRPAYTLALVYHPRRFAARGHIFQVLGPFALDPKYSHHSSQESLYGLGIPLWGA